MGTILDFVGLIRAAQGMGYEIMSSLCLKNVRNEAGIDIRQPKRYPNLQEIRKPQ